MPRGRVLVEPGPAGVSGDARSQRPHSAVWVPFTP